ncbi:MAG: hypothetical protein DBY45_10140 [Clostridiales bacterium]|nr:MAG: hypothetical protein DBY45_10140 [Clostridiales bacterium]
MKPFRKLRLVMFEKDYTQTILSQKIKMSATSLSKKMRGEGEFTLEEIYRIMDILDISYEQMHEYFPRGGRLNKKTVTKGGRRSA